MSVPNDLLRIFLQSCTKELENASIGSSHKSLAEIRVHILELQRTCLARVVEEWKTRKHLSPAVTIQDVQIALRDSNPELARDSSALNDAARGALARLVLCSELSREKESSSSLAADYYASLTTSGELPRTAILEFCGLCTAAVRLPQVQEHLQRGTPLFGSSSSTSNNSSGSTPQERLEAIQRHYLCALGYDPKFGTDEIKRIFFSSSKGYDCEVGQVFGELLQTMNTVVRNASLFAQQEALQQFSDQNDGGVTRIVSVNYSEKIVDAASGRPVASPEAGTAAAPPVGETMHQEQRQREELQMARKAAAMQQEILGELLAMRDEQREETLKRAKARVDEFLQNVLELPPGSERVHMLQSADAETQRYMAMHKVWEGVVASNGGKDPVIHYRKQEPH